ncbi:carbohydrate ABC transporter permease [Micrococcales bacterium 31B]|nr:carbohydrate ABC transporter permease [Micrococcales bacterium 31B]
MKTSTLTRYGQTALGIVFVALLLFPVYWMFTASLAQGGNALNTEWIPLHPDFGGYAKAIDQQGSNLVTSLIVAVGAAVLSVVIATPAAYAMAKLRVRGSKALILAILISQMVPGIVVVNALYSAYNNLGLLNTYGGLILANATAGVPFSILIIRAYMEDFPLEIVEAARVDGCGTLRAFLYVVVPIARNSLITAFIFSFLFAWSDFLMALTLTTGDSLKTITLGLYNYIGANVTDWSSVMATAVLSSVPAVVMMIVAQRYIAAGATGGAVK